MRFKMNDVDGFEDRLGARLEGSSTEDLVNLVWRGSVFLEEESEAHGLDMAWVNNATSAICRSARTLADRIKALEAELSRMKEVEK